MSAPGGGRDRPEAVELPKKKARRLAGFSFCEAAQTSDTQLGFADF